MSVTRQENIAKLKTHCKSILDCDLCPSALEAICSIKNYKNITDDELVRCVQLIEGEPNASSNKA